MRLRTFTSLVLGVAAVLTSRAATAQCAGRVPPSATRFDSLRAPELAGTYRLTMVSQVPGTPSSETSGDLVLWVPDTLFEFYEPEYSAPPAASTSSGVGLGTETPTTALRWRRTAHPHLLAGASTIRLADLAAPGRFDLSSRDPFRPGVRLQGATLFFAPRLGWKPVDGEWTTLHVEWVSAAGFWGTWATTFDQTVPRDAHGHRLRNPHGFFCAAGKATPSPS